jgi:hypothetical protein
MFNACSPVGNVVAAQHVVKSASPEDIPLAVRLVPVILASLIQAGVNLTNRFLTVPAPCKTYEYGRGAAAAAERSWQPVGSIRKVAQTPQSQLPRHSAAFLDYYITLFYLSSRGA